MQRITGLTRILAILNIYLILTLLLKTINPKQKIFYFVLITIISTIIFLAEARGTIVCYFLCIIYLIFFLIKKNFRYKVLLVVILIMFPFFIYLFTKFYKPFSRVGTNSEYTLNIAEKKSNYLERLPNTRYLIGHTSGRLEIWKELLKKYNYKNIIGYGPQADRKLLKKNNWITDRYGNNSSNGFIYAFICGGYLGLFFYALINFKIVKATIDLAIIKKTKNAFFYKLSLIYLVYFLVRQIFENSFSLFSIDFLLVVSSFTIVNYLTTNYKKN